MLEPYEVWRVSDPHPNRGARFLQLSVVTVRGKLTDCYALLFQLITMM